MLEYQDQGPILQPARELPRSGEYDVIVTGGGMAGVGAAIAAARRGCRTLLIERESMLGGLATAGLVNIPLDFACGIGGEMLKNLEAVNGHWHRNTDPEKHKLILDRMVLEAGCDLLFHTQIVDSIVRNDAIRGVVTESKSGRQAWLAKRVIDCSGDADAAYFAECEYQLGRAGDGLTQACSLEFRLAGVEWDTYNNCALKRDDPKWIKLIAEKAGMGWSQVAEVENHLNWITHVPGRPEHCGQDEVSICFAHSRHCHPLDNRDLTRMYLEGREQADLLWRFIKANVPGFEKCWLIDTGCLLGVRDSRRVMGEYVITGWDIASWKHFDDVITISKHGYDIHHPTSGGNMKWITARIGGQTRYVVCNRGGWHSSALPPGGPAALCNHLGQSEAEAEFPEMPFYDIPYRCLVPLKVENLLVAGRCLSADFAAQSGCRLILACINMGQAAGTAAALSLEKGLSPRKVDVRELQTRLMADGMELGQNYREIPGLSPARGQRAAREKVAS